MYRYKFADGPGEWQYTESSLDEATLAIELSDDPSEGCWGEHYRGVEVKSIVLPPREWLIERVACLRESARFNAKTADYYESLLSNGKG